MIKPVFNLNAPSQNKYTQLLIVLVTNFVLAPFLYGIIGELFSSAIFLYAIIIIVRTFSLHQKLFRFYLGGWLYFSENSVIIPKALQDAYQST